MSRALPLVALVGRPNVGKSTLFNRIIGERQAIVAPVAGTTRDRLYAEAEWNGRAFTVVDTGGLDLEDQGEVTVRIRNQVGLALEEADVLVFVTDGLAGVTAADHDVAQLLRATARPVILAVNKTEKQVARLDATEFWALGMGEPCAVSAVHGTGTGDLLDLIAAALPPAEPDDSEDERLHVAFVGRPNVGKSSLLNKLTGQERMVVSGQAGTTRDAVDTVLRYHGEPIVLVDTAGIRRRGRVAPGIEKYSVMRAMRAIERCDVAVLLIDAVDGVTEQDAHIGGYIDEAGKGAIIAVNKWDLIEKDEHTADAFTETLRNELKFLAYAPIVYISALTGQRAIKVIELALQIHETRSLRISTGELNRFTSDLQARHGLTRRGREIKLRYATQVAVSPPSFLFFVNDPALLHFSYRRLIENQLRERFGFEGTPMRLFFREQRRKDED
ncbi:MAG: ribosome biogenesis GTPase Der [Chloroflexi bacterium]|nr:ribosome biogenesis GTPase Der [Chloroflexota bacterium]